MKSTLAAMLLSLDVQRGDRVLALYMPMIAEVDNPVGLRARIGAIHLRSFGGFASHSVWRRALTMPDRRCIVSADAGARAV